MKVFPSFSAACQAQSRALVGILGEAAPPRVLLTKYGHRALLCGVFDLWPLLVSYRVLASVLLLAREAGKGKEFEAFHARARLPLIEGIA